VLEVEDRIVVPDRCLQQALGVVGGRWLHDLQARRVREVRLRILRMEGASVNPAAGRGADHHRDATARAVARLRREVRDHVECAGDEIRELHLRHRPETGDRRTHGGARDRGLGDRRVEPPLLAESLDQAVGHLESAAVNADVFPEQEDSRVALHLLEERFTDRVDVERLRARRGSAGRLFDQRSLRRKEGSVSGAWPA
jgi:hypothetical protein